MMFDVFFFKQKTAYEMRISDWSSDVCSSDLLAGYAEGAWWVQDAAAALPARLLGDVVGKAVVDLCAAPGGKTAQLAAAGAEVIAVERSPERPHRLPENLPRLELGAAIGEAAAAARKSVGWGKSVTVRGDLRGRG